MKMVVEVESEDRLVIRIPALNIVDCERIENAIRSNKEKNLNEKIEYDDVFVAEDKLDEYLKSDKMVAISTELKILIPMRMKSLTSTQAAKIERSSSDNDHHKIIFFAGKKLDRGSRIFTFRYSIHSDQKEIDDANLEGYLAYKLYQYVRDRDNISIEFQEATF